MVRLLAVLAVIEVSIATAVMVLRPAAFEQRVAAILIGILSGSLILWIAGSMPTRAEIVVEEVAAEPVAKRPKLTRVA